MTYEDLGKKLIAIADTLYQAATAEEELTGCNELTLDANIGKSRHIVITIKETPTEGDMNA